MVEEIISIGIVLISYLLGSIPPSYIFGKLFYKVDIRKQGSGNVGGANAIRLFGKKVGLLVAIIDIGKGALAIYIARILVMSSEVEVGFLANSSNIIAIAGFAVVFGHCFSIFLKFSGGKGGATTIGVVLILDPLTAILVIVFWLMIVGTTKFTSLGNLLGVISIPLFFKFRLEDRAYEYMGYSLIILLYFKHRKNIERLINGNERKFGKKENISS